MKSILFLSAVLACAWAQQSESDQEESGFDNGGSSLQQQDEDDPDEQDIDDDDDNGPQDDDEDQDEDDEAPEDDDEEDQEEDEDAPPVGGDVDLARDDDYVCGDGDGVCVRLNSSDEETVSITVSCSNELGWCGVGYGNAPKMVESYILMFWVDEDSTVWSQRRATERAVPEAIEGEGFVTDAGMGYDERWFGGQLTLDITGDLEWTGEMIYASGPPLEDTAEANTTDIDIHDQTGVLPLTESDGDDPSADGVSAGAGTLSSVVATLVASVVALFAA